MGRVRSKSDNFDENIPDVDVTPPAFDIITNMETPKVVQQVSVGSSWYSECSKCGRGIGPFTTAAQMESAPDICEECKKRGTNKTTEKT